LSSEVINVSGCKKNLVVEIPSEQIDEEIDRLALSYASRAKVPGFRPGKVPLSVVKRRFASELRKEATQDLISRSWKQALSDHHLNPLAEPHVEDLKDETGNPLRFTISFEVLPALEVANYEGLSVKVQAPEIEETQVGQALETLREQHAQYAPVEEESISNGHLVTIKLDGEFEGGGKPLHEDDVNLIVGDPRTNEDFSANLRGARIGEARTFTVSFPPDHPRKRFAGKKVHYRLEVKDVKEKHLPGLDDEFARDMGSESLQELRAKIHDDLVRNAERLAEEKAKEEVLDQIVRSHAFDVPDALIEDELEERARQVAAKLTYQGIDVNKTSINWKKVFDEERPHAEQVVRRRMILDAIVRQEGLEVTEAEMDQEFERLSRVAEKSAAALRAQFEKDQRIQSLRAHLLRNKALDFIFRNANISRG
jgi:trigger factor